MVRKLSDIFFLSNFNTILFISVKDEPGGDLGDPSLPSLPFPDTDFKPEDIKLDPNCDFGNGKSLSQ